MSWMTKKQLKRFKSVGCNVLVSESARIFGFENIEIGDNVRIDTDNVIMAAKGFLKLGSHIHIAAGCILLCGGGITVGDYCGISFGSRLISASDDFSGEYLIGPIIPGEFTRVTSRPIVLEKFSAVGANAVILTGATLEIGSVLGAMSLAKPDQQLAAWMIYAGIPAKAIKRRDRGLIEKAREFELQFTTHHPSLTS